jgi:hypothetical protein
MTTITSYLKYRAVWYKKGTVEEVLGVLTNYDNAKTETLFKRDLGLTAWLEDENGNRIWKV